MISFFDTNLLLCSLNRDCAEYHDSRACFASLPAAPGAVAICELVLIELYVLLRNSAVLSSPLDPASAAAIIQPFRQHPTYLLIDYLRFVKSVRAIYQMEAEAERTRCCLTQAPAPKTEFHEDSRKEQ